MLADLVERDVVGVDDDGHAGEVGVLGAADDERIDVKSACGKHTGDPGEDAGLVDDQGGDDVAHKGPSCCKGTIIPWRVARQGEWKNPASQDSEVVRGLH